MRGNSGCSSVTGRATCQRVEVRCTHRVVLRFYVQKMVELVTQKSKTREQLREQGVGAGASACAIAIASACGCGCGCG
jgi:hypothetical protein